MSKCYVNALTTWVIFEVWTMAKGPYLHLEPVFLSLRLGRMLQGTRTAFAPVLGGTHPTPYCSGVWTPDSAFPTC